MDGRLLLLLLLRHWSHRWLSIHGRTHVQIEEKGRKNNNTSSLQFRRKEKKDIPDAPMVTFRSLISRSFEHFPDENNPRKFLDFSASFSPSSPLDGIDVALLTFIHPPDFEVNRMQKERNEFLEVSRVTKKASGFVLR